MLRSRIDSPVTQKYCGVRSQQIVTASGGEILYIFKEMTCDLRCVWSRQTVTVSGDEILYIFMEIAIKVLDSYTHAY